LPGLISGDFGFAFEAKHGMARQVISVGGRGWQSHGTIGSAIDCAGFGRHHRSWSSAGAAGAGDRLAVSRSAFSSVYAAGDGRPPLPTRLVAGLFILKHTHNLSDEALCARWLENPYSQFFCGELSFCHRLPFDRSSLTLLSLSKGAPALG
jgi:Transposase domain (DUF772)